MNDKPSIFPTSPRPDDAARRPDPDRAGGPAAQDDDGPLDSLGKAIIEPVLGADRTTTADRVREKLDRKDGPPGR